VGTLQQWKVHCYNDYTAIVIDHMDLSEGDYLQVRDERYSGKLTRPKSRIIQKSSVGVIFSGVNGNSTGFHCAFLCIGKCNAILSYCQGGIFLQRSTGELGQNLFYTMTRLWTLSKLVTLCAILVNHILPLSVG